MKYLLTLLSFSIFLPAQAEEVSVQMMNSDKPAVSQPGFEYIPKSQGPIDSAERDKFFEKAGFGPNLTSFDEVEKNVLYLRLKKLPLERLKKLYPKLPVQALTKASSALGGPQ